MYFISAFSSCFKTGVYKVSLDVYKSVLIYNSVAGICVCSNEHSILLIGLNYLVLGFPVYRSTVSFIGSTVNTLHLLPET